MPKKFYGAEVDYAALIRDAEKGAGGPEPSESKINDVLEAARGIGDSFEESAQTAGRLRDTIAELNRNVQE